MIDDDYYCDVDDPDFFTEDHMERYFADEDEPKKKKCKKAQSEDHDEDLHQ